jgi:hypothetical protein
LGAPNLVFVPELFSARSADRAPDRVIEELCQQERIDAEPTSAQGAVAGQEAQREAPQEVQQEVLQEEQLARQAELGEDHPHC